METALINGLFLILGSAITGCITLLNGHLEKKKRSDRKHEQVLEPVELLDIAFPANAAGLPQNFAFREVFCDLCVYRLSGKISTFHSAFEFVLCAKRNYSQKRRLPETEVAFFC